LGANDDLNFRMAYCSLSVKFHFIRENLIKLSKFRCDVYDGLCLRNSCLLLEIATISAYQ
ncbi:hypothetical protein, partial [Nostoc sp. CHAB 5715]|uniref:hypothetical protein n=1 Tax=Nostoc sp. CHAB 5715 TaxID=2780400 RepID=UPI001E650062